MMAPNKPGTVKLDVFVKSDSYIGLDQRKAVQFEVISADTLPQYEPHPDDLELDNEPTLFEQVMQAYDDETDSEDDEVGTALCLFVCEVSWQRCRSQTFTFAAFFLYSYFIDIVSLCFVVVVKGSKSSISL